MITIVWLLVAIEHVWLLFPSFYSGGSVANFTVKA
ncbi:hypothetical protein T02_834 [Trichinella nativa]|uniref:Uncharacterized protein n=1 Tax=Trichinella nativa TaxID=6335 RepID=A0A0V1KHC6_9BILA|nr:hypothetical protein T02_834 [Trichinella nativa]